MNMETLKENKKEKGKHRKNMFCPRVELSSTTEE